MVSLIWLFLFCDLLSIVCINYGNSYNSLRHQSNTNLTSREMLPLLIFPHSVEFVLLKLHFTLRLCKIFRNGLIAQKSLIKLPFLNEIPALLDKDKIVSTLRVIDGNIKCGN